MLRTALLAGIFAAGFVSVASAGTLYFQAKMTSAAEVPPTKSSGTGMVMATLDTASKTLSYKATWENLSGPAGAAHFHGPAAAGKNAGVQVPIGGKAPTSPVYGSATLTDAQVKQLESGMWYANVHTKDNPGGEIRGQVREQKMAMAKPKAAAPMGNMPMKGAPAAPMKK